MPQFLDTTDPDFETTFAALLGMKREDSPDVDAVVAGIIMGLIQQFAAGYLDGHWGLYGTADVLPYIILLIILLFKPHGLFGIHEIERV